MSGRQLHDVFEECIRRGSVAIEQVLVQCVVVDGAWNARFKQGFDLGAKDQTLPIAVVVQWLLAKTITGGKQSLAFSVPQSEGEHAAQVFDTIISVLLVGMNNGFGVALSAKMMPTLPQFFL